MNDIIIPAAKNTVPNKMYIYMRVSYIYIYIYIYIYTANVGNPIIYPPIYGHVGDSF